MITQFRDEYRFLSNFYLIDIEYKGRIFPSTEHAYMSEKSNDITWKEYCANKNISPSDVKKNSKLIRLIDGWDEIKLSVMEDVLRIKFKDENLKKLLLDTGNQNIQEGNTWKDRFWGVDLNVNPNFGENHLGRLIMKIRDEIRMNNWEIKTGGTLQ